jgi:hypothetical protein
MSSSSAPNSASRLEEVSLKFVSAPSNQKILERHHRAILNFRARGASISEIHNFLRQHNVTVSQPALTRFCQKYREEVQRLRLMLEREGEPVTPPATTPRTSVQETTVVPTSTPQSTPNPITSPTRKMRDLRGEV